MRGRGKEDEVSKGDAINCDTSAAHPKFSADLVHSLLRIKEGGLPLFGNCALADVHVVMRNEGGGEESPDSRPKQTGDGSHGQIESAHPCPSPTRVHENCVNATILGDNK